MLCSHGLRYDAEAQLAAATERADRLGRERYLPTECPICGRNRLIYKPRGEGGTTHCEKCGSDDVVIALTDSNYDRAEAAESRAMQAEGERDLYRAKAALAEDLRRLTRPQWRTAYDGFCRDYDAALVKGETM
jgi:hypothetical protein